MKPFWDAQCYPTYSTSELRWRAQMRVTGGGDGLEESRDDKWSGCTMTDDQEASKAKMATQFYCSDKMSEM